MELLLGVRDLQISRVETKGEVRLLPELSDNICIRVSSALGKDISGSEAHNGE